MSVSSETRSAPVRSSDRGPEGPAAKVGYQSRVRDVLRSLEAYGDRNDWVGTDPYEGLNATRLVGPLRRSFRGRQLIIQSVKRSPVDLRGPLGIEPAQNSATLAWVASSYARGDLLSEEEGERRLRRTLEGLERLRCGGFGEPCWGYHFDTQSRVFFYSKLTNTIATAFVAQALLDAFDRTGEERLLRGSRQPRAILPAPHRSDQGRPGALLGYIVGDHSPIQNANTHACAVLARLSRHLDEERFLRAAQDGIEYALSRQRPDGSWLYGERPDLAWVDGYHHGYVLDALRVCDDAAVDEAPGGRDRARPSVLRARAAAARRHAEVLLPQDLSDRLTVLRPGDPDLLDRRHPRSRLHRSCAPGLRLDDREHAPPRRAVHVPAKAALEQPASAHALGGGGAAVRP